MGRNDGPGWRDQLGRWLRRNAAVISAAATVAGAIIGIIR
jgi:hypothetical protein